MPHPEVLLHDGARVLETVTSNVAVRMPRARAAARARGAAAGAAAGASGSEDDAEGGIWVTPPATSVLPGTVRAELLSKGVVVEGEITLEDWREAGERGWEVRGFNGFR